MRAEEKTVSEDEMAGQHHGCNEHELRQTPGDCEGQGGLACCSPWGCKESDTTGQLGNISIHPTLSFPCRVRKSVLCVCVSIPALQIDFFFKERIKEHYIIVCQNQSVSQFSRSVVSDSLRPHELQHARPPCPSPTPAVHSDSRPLSP